MGPSRDLTQGRITRQTLIPLGLVITIMGGVFFVANLYQEVQAHAAAISETVQALKSIDERLSRIEGKLGINR